MPRPSFEDLDPVLRAGAIRVARRLGAASEEAWLVGGAVRNLALGLPAADADLATGALPDRVLELFPRSLAVGKAFGTIIVRLGSETWSAAETADEPELDEAQREALEALDIEVTTFRSEDSYSDGRRPDEVRFGADAAEDAERRDFTCNALFLEVLTGELFDPTGGLADLEARRLRCVGDPLMRFTEDGLRLLRLARFHARYGLEVEEPTLAAAKASKSKLLGVSAERRLQEFEKLLSSPGSKRAIELFDQLEIWPQVLSGSEIEVAKSDAAAPLTHLPDPPGAALGWAAVLSSVALEPAADRCLEGLKALKAPQALAQECAAILGLGLELEEVATREWLQRLKSDLAAYRRFLRQSALSSALQLAWARNRAVTHDAEALECLEALSDELARAEHSTLWPKALLNGKDLAGAGIPPGPRFGELLRELEDLQLAERVDSRDQALAWLAERAAE